MEKPNFTVQVEYLHRQPDVIRYSNLLSPEECQELIDLGEPHLAQSRCFSGLSQARTSSTTFLTNYYNDPTVRAIVQRCAALCGLEARHAEPPQLVRYLPGQKFDQHLDNYAQDSWAYKTSGQRIYTFFIYLNSPPEFGQDGQVAEGCSTRMTMLDGKSKTLDVTPIQGSAAFWRNTLETGADDIRAYHRGMPGNWVKYGLNLWFREKPYRDVPMPAI